MAFIFLFTLLSIQDQMILFMGLADGESVLRTGPVTLHTESAIFITQQLTGAKFDIRYCNNAVFGHRCLN